MMRVVVAEGCAVLVSVLMLMLLCFVLSVIGHVRFFVLMQRKPLLDPERQTASGG